MKYQRKEEIEITHDITIMNKYTEAVPFNKGTGAVIEFIDLEAKNYVLRHQDKYVGVSIDFLDRHSKSVFFEDKMYARIIERGLTYGQAVDMAIHGGKKVTRAIWRGYWVVCELSSMYSLEPTKMIIAVLRDHKGTEPATPYNEDMYATDWMVVE